MANLIPLLENLSNKDIQELINACISFDAKNILGPEYDEVVSYHIPRLKISWKTKAEFEKDIKFITGARSIVEANKILEKRLLTPEQKEKPIESNLPDKEARELLEMERERRETEIKETTEKAQKEVEASVKRKQEYYKKYLVEKEALANKRVVVVPKGGFTEVPLTPAEKLKIYHLAQAVIKDPNTAQTIIEQKIREAVNKSSNDIKNNVSESVIKNAAADFIAKVKPFTEYKKPEDIPDKFVTYNPASPFTAIADPNNQKLKEIVPEDSVRAELIKNAGAVAASIDAENSVNGALITPLFEDSPEITYLFYQKNATQFEISENQEEQQSKDNGIDIDLKEIYDYGKDAWDIWKKLSTKATTVNEVVTTYYPVITPPALAASSISIAEASNSTLLALTTTVGAITGPTIGAFTGRAITMRALGGGTSVSTLMLGAGNMGSMVAMAAPSMASMSGVFFINNAVTKGFGAMTASGKLGFFAAQKIFAGGTRVLAAGINIGKSSLAIFASSKGLQIVTSGAFAKLGAMLGSFAPIVGNIVGAVVGFLFGKLLEKIPWDKIKSFLKDYGPALAIGLLGGGALLGSVPLVGAGALMLAAGVPAAGGVAGAAASIGAFFGTLLSGLAVAIGGPVIIGFFTTSIIVALTLFIINSGAYVVPPTAGIFGNESSPYIGITKIPTPPGPFENSVLPETVSYEVTITAKKGPLSNVKIGYDCVVISATQSKCPSITDIPTFVPTISPSTPYKFTYTSTYSKSYIDSSIIDTITVTADTTDKSGVMADGSASITFGVPPISCPLPEGKPLNSMNYSYNAQANTGHGSTQYWSMMGGTPYRYSLPQQTGCNRPSDCPYYGYSYDVFPTTSIKTVYAPTVLGKKVTWIFKGSFPNQSAGNSLIYTDTTNTYTLVLTHVATSTGPSMVTSGTAISTLFEQGSNTHLHIEFQMNGNWVKPENYFCK